MISTEELRTRAADLGVPSGQIARDHLISHVLHALSQVSPQNFAFFGGTALCRTWCDDMRLFEDVDLLVDDCVQGAETLSTRITRGIRREFPDARWEDLGRRHEIETKMLDVGGDIAVKVQFARWRDAWRALSIAPTSVKLRYSDLPAEVRLVVSTPAAFVAMKLVAWGNRQAPRDLFDLRALALEGHFTLDVLELVRELTGCSPSSATLGSSIPRGVVDSWTAELGHQLGDLPEPDACLQVVRQALNRLNPPVG